MVISNSAITLQGIEISLDAVIASAIWVMAAFIFIDLPVRLNIAPLSWNRDLRPMYSPLDGESLGRTPLTTGYVSWLNLN